jgi:DNA-binding response OmpR family regulator
MLLSGVTVLLVDEDVESLEVLTAHLRGQGAEVISAGSASAGVWAVRQDAPDVVICEMDLSDLEGRSLLAVLRSSPGCDNLPAIALTAHTGLIARAQALGAGFEKYLVKPTRFSDVTNAICCLVQERRQPSSGTVAQLSELGDAINRHDYRSLMATLNAATTHRNSGFFTLDGDRLASVWTYDRESPNRDRFPWGVRVSETLCARVIESGCPLLVEDANGDERVTLEQRRYPMRSFCGVPLHAERGGAVTGVLCHFDARPHPADGRVLDLLERTARLFKLLAVAV